MVNNSTLTDYTRQNGTVHQMNQAAPSQEIHVIIIRKI